MFDAHLPFSNIISFIACVRLVNYAMVTDGNREANLIAMVAVRANSVKCLLLVIVYHMISNAEKEKLVLDLYYTQRKIVRQTAQEAGMSFRDIAAVLKKKEEAAAVNGDGSRNGNGKVAMDNQQQQLGNDSLLPCICNLSSSFSFLRSWL
jgi:hypothetical protein